MGLPDIESIPETGAVFTIGRSRFADNVASHFFIRKDPVLTITCGDEHSAVVCQSGRLFVFGSNDWGQLGLGHKNHVNKPSCVKILKPEKVTHVACGRAHTLICTGGQKIFACGSDQEGQLGRGNSAIGDSASTPVLVYDCGLAGPRIVQIAAGSHHSMALTSDGGVVAWGSNLEGQLGLSGISGLVNKPTKVPIPEPVKEISTGYYHSAFLTGICIGIRPSSMVFPESGLVYVCGESESGKLGIDVNFSTQVAPKQMQLPTPAIHVACGGHHTLILTENGNIYCVGSNASGQLGMGTNVTEVPTPKLLSRDALQDQSIVKIACGESHSAVLTESGVLYTCGDGRHGKLGLEENENNVHELTFAVKYQELFVSNVSCGGCHTILLGRRRETNDQLNPEVESVQMDHQMQKKNPLPPLKLPVNRLQNESHTDKTDEAEKKESMESEENIHEKSLSEDNQENKLDNSSSNIHESAKDRMNNIEKAPEMSAMSIATQKLIETEKSEAMSEEKDVENNNEEKTTKTDMENNVDTERPTESITENSNPSHPEEKTDETISNLESKTEEEEKSNPEKLASPEPTPPPKPPRQKLGSPQGSDNKNMSPNRSSLDEQKEINPNTEEKEVNENNNSKTNETMEKQLETQPVPEETKKEEESTTKLSANSHKSRSTKSNAGTDETIVADTQNNLDEVKPTDKVVENEKNDVEHAHDDADVIQSPAPRTGKMAKLFKAKKQQELENGTKSSGTTPKSKSKTCNVL